MNYIFFPIPCSLTDDLEHTAVLSTIILLVKFMNSFTLLKKNHCQYFVRCFAMLSYKPLWFRDPCRINLLWVPNRKTWVWRTSDESRIHLYKLQLYLVPVVAMTRVVGFISTHVINGYNNLDFRVWSLYMASCSQYNLML